MPEYTFECANCGEQEALFLSVSRYESVMGIVPNQGPSATDKIADGIKCSSCSEEMLRRAPRLVDDKSSYTEKQMFWGDCTPLNGLGGYSRERQKILDAHGLRQKDGSKRKPRKKRRNYDPSRVTIG